MEKGTLYSLPQRTTLTVKFQCGTQGELLSCKGTWQDAQFGEFEHAPLAW